MSLGLEGPAWGLGLFWEAPLAPAPPWGPVSYTCSLAARDQGSCHLMVLEANHYRGSFKPHPGLCQEPSEADAGRGQWEFLQHLLHLTPKEQSECPGQRRPRGSRAERTFPDGPLLAAR